MKEKKIANVLIIIILAVFASFFLSSMMMGIIISFTDWNGMSSDFSFVGLQNYIAMFSDQRLLNSLSITLVYSFVLLITCIVLGFMSAKVLEGLTRVRPLALFISFFPYVVTPVIVCILWSQIYTGLIPPLGKALNFEWLSHNLLAGKQTAIFAVIFVDLWMLVPYSMLLFLSGLNSIPSDLKEYAGIEGASRWQKFRFVEFPHLVPTLGLLVTIIFSYAFTGLDTIMTLTAGGPGRSTETIYYLIYKNSTMEQRYGYGLAEGLLVSLLSIAVFVLVNRITNGKNVDDITMGV